jgi:hypothetical protein
MRLSVRIYRGTPESSSIFFRNWRTNVHLTSVIVAPQKMEEPFVRDRHARMRHQTPNSPN